MARPETISEFILTDLYALETTIRLREPLSRHTTMGIGGEAQIFLKPLVANRIPEIFSYLKKLGYEIRILGGGSNLLVEEGTLPFCVLDMTDLQGYETRVDGIFVQAGCSLRIISRVLARQGYSGLEFAAGIPGSVGGAIVMNAGAYGGQISDRIVSVETFDPFRQEFEVISKEDCSFSYRNSRFSSTDSIIVGATLRTQLEEREIISAKMQDYERKRVEKQPLECLSAGSVFKKPSEDFHVGQIIEELGLKGYRLGGAEISTKHAGFIINRFGATFNEVLRLIELIQTKVYQRTRVFLQPEIKIWRKNSLPKVK